MSREIKFRVWDKLRKEWIKDSQFSSVYIDLEGDVSRFGFVFETFESEDDAEVMQFTGLHDKNGKEIYEGDIVQGTNRIHDDWRIPQLVSFLNGCFMFGSWNAHEYFNRHQEIEVIGNIYEDPELIQT